LSVIFISSNVSKRVSRSLNTKILSRYKDHQNVLVYLNKTGYRVDGACK